MEIKLQCTLKRNSRRLEGDYGVSSLAFVQGQKDILKAATSRLSNNHSLSPTTLAPAH